VSCLIFNTRYNELARVYTLLGHCFFSSSLLLVPLKHCISPSISDRHRTLYFVLPCLLPCSALIMVHQNFSPCPTFGAGQSALQAFKLILCLEAKQIIYEKLKKEKAKFRERVLHSYFSGISLILHGNSWDFIGTLWHFTKLHLYFKICSK
jgi:hypothetical protein